MTVKDDYADGDDVTAAEMNALGTAVNTVAAQDIPGQVSTAVAAQDIPGKVSTAVAAQDIPGQISNAVGSSSTIIDAADAAVSSNIAGRSLVQASDSVVLQKNINPNVYFGIADNNDRMAFAVYADGTIRIFKLDLASIGDGTITAAKLTATVQAQLVGAGVGSMLQSNVEESGYVWAVVDSSGRIGLGVKKDGTVVGKYPIVDGSITTAKLDPAIVARIPPAVWALPKLPEITGTTPSRKLWALDQTTGQRTLVTDVNDPREAVEDNGAIIFTDNNGRRAYTGGLVVPAFPDRSTIAAFGDSLTEGYPTPEFSPSTAWPAVLDSLVSASVVNLGKTGQSIDEIVIRQGGYTLNLSVTAGNIPASGSVVVTSSQGYCHRFDRSWSQTGTLAGVPGTLSRGPSDPVGQYTFARTTSGSAVAVAGSAPFISDAAVANESRIAVLFAGRNDVGYSPAGIAIADPVTRMLAAFDAFVARLRAYHKEFLVLGTTTSTVETTGTSGYNTVTSVNNALSAKYGGRFYDLRHYLVTQAIYDIGATPTTTDLAKMAADTLPPSIMATSGTDAIHYSPATAAQVAAQLKIQLDQRGWTAA